MTKAIVLALTASLLVGLATPVYAGGAASEDELKSLFGKYYDEKDMDGLMTLFYAEGASDNVVGFVKGMLGRHIRRGFPIENMEIMDLTDDMAAALSRPVAMTDSTQVPNLTAEKLFTAIFKGSEELTSFQAPVGVKDGVYYFIMSAPQVE